MKVIRSPLELLLICLPGTQQDDPMSGIIAAVLRGFEGDPDAPFGRPAGPRVRVIDSEVMKHVQNALKRSTRVALVPLIGPNWVAAQANTLAEELAQVMQPHPAELRMFPVGLHGTWNLVFQNTTLQNAQGLLRHDTQFAAVPVRSRVVADLMQECTAWLLGRAGAQLSVAFEVFLSHAKRDGVALTTQIRDAIERDARLRGFFDARDIVAGQDYAQVLTQQAGGAQAHALLVVQTDAHSTRPWCHREVVAAKAQNVVMLVVDALEEGEARSFPYQGNVRTVRVDPAKPDLFRIIAALMHECLRARYFELDAKQRVPTRAPVNRPPELLGVRQKVVNLVYPDPALGNSERDLLPGASSAMSLQQAILEDLQVPERFTNLTIALSASDSPDLSSRGLTASHTELAWMELNRLLFSLGINIAYGGDHRLSGLTEQLIDLADAHRRDEQRYAPITNYLALHMGATVTAERRIDLMHLIKVIDVESPAADPNLGASFQQALNFTAMRRRMARDSQARILIGGKRAGVSGRYVGLAEEALIHLQEGKPIYLIGYLGGCAHALADWMAGGNDNPLLDLQPKPEVAQARARFPADGTDPDQIYNQTQHGEQLRSLYQQSNNGLDAAEREQLAKSEDLSEVLQLLALGISRRFVDCAVSKVS